MNTFQIVNYFQWQRQSKNLFIILFKKDILGKGIRKIGLDEQNIFKGDFMKKNIEIPDSVYNSMKIPDKEKENVILQELALALYKEEILSFGKARELAGLSKEEFHDLLGKKEIERHYNFNNLKEDFDYGKN